MKVNRAGWPPLYVTQSEEFLYLAVHPEWNFTQNHCSSNFVIQLLRTSSPGSPMLTEQNLGSGCLVQRRWAMLRGHSLIIQRGEGVWVEKAVPGDAAGPDAFGSEICPFTFPLLLIPHRIPLILSSFGRQPHSAFLALQRGSASHKLLILGTFLL